MAAGGGSRGGTRVRGPGRGARERARLELADRGGPPRLVLAEHVGQDLELPDGRQRAPHALRPARTATPTSRSGAGSRTPVTTTASRSSTPPIHAEPEQLVDFDSVPARSTTSRSGGTCCSSRSRRRGPAHACDSVTQIPGLRGHPHLRRLQPARAAPDHGRADRLRLAHAHAGARCRERPGAALRRVVHVGDQRPPAVVLRERVPALRAGRLTRAGQDLGRRGPAGQPG